MVETRTETAELTKIGESSRNASNEILLERIEQGYTSNQAILDRIKDEKLRSAVELALEDSLLEGRLQVVRRVLFKTAMPTSKHEQEKPNG